MTEDLLVERIARLLAGARPLTVMVQLRDRELAVKHRLAFGARLAAACRKHEQWFVVNDRLDVARLLGADGVHLGEGGVETEDARALLPPGAWVSCACHDPAAIAGCGADAVLLSPVALPRKGRAALGASGVASARAAIDRMVPTARPLLYALGGVTAADAATWLAAGASGVAVIGAALDGDDPAPLLAALGIRRDPAAK